MRTSILLLFVCGCCAVGCGRSLPPLEEGQTAERWIEELKSDKTPVRVKAVKKLGTISSRDAEAMPAIFDALKDKEPLVRREAIYAIARNRTVSSDGWPLLEEMKDKDSDPEVRKIAAEAFENLTEQK